MYAAVNGQNKVVAIDAIKQSWTVGAAPRGGVRVGTKLWAGVRRSRATSRSSADHGRAGTTAVSASWLGSVLPGFPRKSGHTGWIRKSEPMATPV